MWKDSRARSAAPAAPCVCESGRDVGRWAPTPGVFIRHRLLENARCNAGHALSTRLERRGVPGGFEVAKLLCHRRALLLDVHLFGRINDERRRRLWRKVRRGDFEAGKIVFESATISLSRKTRVRSGVFDAELDPTANPRERQRGFSEVMLSTECHEPPRSLVAVVEGFGELPRRELPEGTSHLFCPPRGEFGVMHRKWMTGEHARDLGAGADAHKSERLGKAALVDERKRLRGAVVSSNAPALFGRWWFNARIPHPASVVPSMKMVLANQGFKPDRQLARLRRNHVEPEAPPFCDGPIRCQQHALALLHETSIVTREQPRDTPRGQRARIRAQAAPLTIGQTRNAFHTLPL